MKKLVLLLFAGFMCINMFSQISENPEIGINKMFPYGSNPDTTRTFSIIKTDKEKCIAIMIATFGDPTLNSIGHYSWNVIDIKDVGEGLVIKLTDGLQEFKGQSFRLTPFKDEKTKIKQLKSLKKNQSRYMIIEICDKTDNNIIINNQLENIIVDFLKNVFKDVK